MKLHYNHLSTRDIWDGPGNRMGSLVLSPFKNKFNKVLAEFDSLEYGLTNKEYYSLTYQQLNAPRRFKKK